MSKHTQGQWVVEGHQVWTSGSRRTSAIEVATLRICDVADGHGEAGDVMANARLIATAPDMLEFLKMISASLDETGTWTIKNGQVADNILYSIIKKVEGTE